MQKLEDKFAWGCSSSRWKTPSRDTPSKANKAPNCSEHPGSHKARKSKCEHLSAHDKQFREENTNAIIAAGNSDTRAKARACEELETMYNYENKNNAS